ncbi:MAG: hypothetical protein WCS17_05310 [Prevotella sp.]
MNQKNISIYLFLLFLLPILSFTSCNKDSNEQLSLHQVENNEIELYYGSIGGVTIVGGDGIYSFTCESPLLKAEMTHSNYILFEPLGVGEARVRISDSSGDSYILKVKMNYKSEKIVVGKLGVTVVGDNMTIGDQKELKEKALATIPVKVGGGYKFTYTESDEKEVTKGVVLIYPEKVDAASIKGTFERKMVKNESGGYSSYIYTLHYKDVNRTFIFMEYTESVTRSTSAFRAVQFAEDLKEQFKTAYPNVEQVYTSQVIESIVVE